MVIRILLSALAMIMVVGTASAQTVGIGSNQAGSLFHRTSVAVAQLMNEKMGIKARVQPFSGSSMYIPMLNRNEVQLSMISVGECSPSNVLAGPTRPIPGPTPPSVVAMAETASPMDDSGSRAR